MAVETAKTISEFKQLLNDRGQLGVTSDLYEHRELIKTGAGWGGGVSPTLIETRETEAIETVQINLESEEIDFGFGYGLYRGRLDAQKFLNQQEIREATGLPHVAETGAHNQQMIDVYDRLLEDAEQANMSVDIYLAHLLGGFSKHQCYMWHFCLFPTLTSLPARRMK